MRREAPLEARLQRLGTLIRTVVERCRALEDDNRSLRAELVGREERIRDLDERLLHLHQSRQDAAKRLDELISRLDHLDEQLAAPASD